MKLIIISAQKLCKYNKSKYKNVGMSNNIQIKHFKNTVQFNIKNPE
jgi:hypothetical protein